MGVKQDCNGKFVLFGGYAYWEEFLKDCVLMSNDNVEQRCVRMTVEIERNVGRKVPDSEKKVFIY